MFLMFWLQMPPTQIFKIPDKFLLFARISNWTIFKEDIDIVFNSMLNTQNDKYIYIYISCIHLVTTTGEMGNKALCLFKVDHKFQFSSWWRSEISNNMF